MCSKGSAAAACVFLYILFVVRFRCEYKSLAVILLCSGVVCRITPQAHTNSGSVGVASAERAQRGEREPRETRLLSGGSLEGGFRIPFSWRPEVSRGVDRLTGHISRMLACRIGSTSQEALWLSLEFPYTPYLQLR